MEPSAGENHSKAPQTCSGGFPRTKKTLLAQPPPSMPALWRSHCQDRHVLPAPSSCSPRATTEPGLLGGTKGPHSISSSCPCSAPPPFAYTQQKIPVSQLQPKYQLSLGCQPASPTPTLHSSSSEPSPGASFMSVTPVSPCCPHHGDRTPSPPPF